MENESLSTWLVLTLILSAAFSLASQTEPAPIECETDIECCTLYNDC